MISLGAFAAIGAMMFLGLGLGYLANRFPSLIYIRGEMDCWNDEELTGKAETRT